MNKKNEVVMTETQLNGMDNKPRIALINKPKLDVSVALVIREEKGIKETQ